MGDPTKNQDKVLSLAALASSTDVLEKASRVVGVQAEVLSKGPSLLFAGVDAAAMIAKILPTATTITVTSGFGPVELRPGTIWSGDRILVSADTVFTRYAVGDQLYEWGTSSFLREEWFRAVGGAMAQAKAFVYLAQFEIALISGLFVPWYLLLGVSAASLGLTYYHNRDTYNTALKKAPQVLRLLQDLRARSPTLFKKLISTAAKDILSNLPSGVSGEDIAFFIGRVVRGVAGAPQVTLGAVLRTTVKVGLIVAGTHLPKVTAEAISAAASARAGELQARLAEQGITTSQDEAESILRELLAKPDTPKKLRELEENLGELIPVLERLSQVLHR
jgi:hypothetical protein